MRILLTGADGFLGQNIVGALLRDGHDVYGISNGAGSSPDIHFRKVDITDRAAVFEAAAWADADMCIHLAAMAHANVPADREHWVRAVNVHGSMNVLDALESVGTKNVIYFSTAKVLAETTPPEGIDETATPNPCGIYPVSKIEVERSVLQRTESGTLRGTIVRPTAVLGKGDAKGNYAKMIRMVSRGFFPLFDGGRARRSLVFSHRLAERIRIMVRQGIHPGRCYVLSDGAFTLQEIIDTARCSTGYAFCPNVPLGFWKGAATMVDRVCDSLRPGTRPIGDRLRRLTDSFVIRTHLWDEEYGAFPPIHQVNEMRRVVETPVKESSCRLP